LQEGLIRHSGRAISRNFSLGRLVEAASPAALQAQRAGSRPASRAAYWSAAVGRLGDPLTLMPKQCVFVAGEFQIPFVYSPPNAPLRGWGTNALTPLGASSALPFQSKRPSEPFPGRVFCHGCLASSGGLFLGRLPCLACWPATKSVGPDRLSNPFGAGFRLTDQGPARGLVQNMSGCQHRCDVDPWGR